MIDKKELQHWLKTLTGDAVGIDEGGLTLREIEDGALTGAYLEIGGIPEAIEDSGHEEADDGPLKTGLLVTYHKNGIESAVFRNLFSDGRPTFSVAFDQRVESVQTATAEMLDMAFAADLDSTFHCPHCRNIFPHDRHKWQNCDRCGFVFTENLP